MNFTAILTHYKKTLAILFFCSLIFLLSKNIGFFWDNVLLSSTMGHYMYNNGLFTLNFPESFDPGHPPTLAFINALAWKILGKKLWVSHLVAMPFLFGLVWQLHNFIAYFTSNKIHQIVAIAFIFCDATILAQTFYTGQEIPQLFLFLLALNQLLKGNYFLKCIALLCLSICSLRGAMLSGGFFVVEIFYYTIIKKNNNLLSNKKNIAVYILASSAILAFIAWRLANKGWIQTHENSPWEDLWHIASLKTFLFNVVVLIHRFLDFGKIAVLLFLMYGLLIFKRKLWQDDNVKLLVATTILSTSIVTIISLAATNTIAHRYYAISFIFMHLLALYLLNNFIKSKKKLLVALLSFCLATGNLWQYPIKYAQGWDASLRSLPYFNLRTQAINYLTQNNIAIENVGTFFPNVNTIENISVNNDNRKFAEYDTFNKYVLVSNVYNLKTATYTQLQNYFISIKKINNYGIWVDVLKNKKEFYK